MKDNKKYLVFHQFKEQTRLDNYTVKLVGQALLISSTYFQSNFNATVKSQWKIPAEPNSYMAHQSLYYKEKLLGLNQKVLRLKEYHFH